MFKNENHEAWHGQHDSIELYSFCPEGYYPVDRGKWCQHYERGPSGVIGGIPGQKIKPIASQKPSLVPARLVTSEFRGSTDDLINRIIELNQSYFNNVTSYSRVQDAVSTLRETVSNGIFPEGGGCVTCLGTNEQNGFCIENICVSEISLFKNRGIICLLKLRY